MGPNAELEFRNWVPNCRNEIAIGFVEIGLTLKRGKGPDLPTPDPACGPHPVCTGPSLKKIEAISEFQAISERSSAPFKRDRTQTKARPRSQTKRSLDQRWTALDGTSPGLRNGGTPHRSWNKRFTQINPDIYHVAIYTVNKKTILCTVDRDCV
jgi:hypothetical protein